MSVSTTETYARASTEAQRRSVEAVEKIVPESDHGKEQRAELDAWLRRLL